MQNEFRSKHHGQCRVVHEHTEVRMVSFVPAPRMRNAGMNSSGQLDLPWVCRACEKVLGFP